VLVVLGIATQLAIVAHAPDTVHACDAVDVSVAVSSSGSIVPRVTAPSFRPFDLLRNTNPHIEYRSRLERSSMLAEFRYTITTDRAGTYTIPPFEARLGEERVLSQPLVIAVRPSRVRGVPSVVARARIDTSSGLELASAAAAETVYVGQQATYEVAVFLNQTVRERLRRNPTFYPPEMQAMLAYDLPAPSRAARERVGSQCFDALVYRRALFPLVAGRLVIPPAQLVYSTGLSSSSLFSREESHELQTDSVTIIAVEPPVSGRPTEYSGAVGDLRLESELDSTRSRVGDPLLVTVRVAGTGNVKLFPRPVIRVPWAGLVAADERVRIDSNNARVGGSKEFDWVLTPRIAGEFDVPPVRYGYFDPARRRYEIASTPAGRMRVGPGVLASADTGQAESALAIRTSYGGPAWQPLHAQPLFWLAMLIAPLPALVGRARRRTAAAQRAAPPDPMRVLMHSAARDAVTLRRQFVKGLAQRLGCNPEDFTHPGALERALRRAGVSSVTSARAESLLRALDAAAYAGQARLPQDATRAARAIAAAVNVEALRRVELPFSVPAILLAVSVVAAGSAMAADPAAEHFARGVSAYMRHDYGSAQTAFGVAAELSPRSADAWANFGTAAWSRADTAAALLGWRQGLAIEPAASDLQHYVKAIRDLGPTAPGWVPPLPRDAAVWLFAALWFAGWTIAWLAQRPRAWQPSWLGRFSLPMIVCSMIVGVIAIEVQTLVSGTRLAVVRRTTPLTTDPAIGMDRGPAVGTGEIVRIVGRRGAWTRVEAAEDRDGWIAASQLLLVADRRPSRD
jgi:tetratricopeptide (TPR) repeat protein